MPSIRRARRSATSARSLPEGVIGPFFNDEFGDTYISLYALTGPGFSYPELKDFAKAARDMLLRIPGVAKVDLLGLQEERIFIEVSSVALAQRGLSALDIAASARRPERHGSRGPDRDGRALGAHRRCMAGSNRSRTSASCGCASGKQTFQAGRYRRSQARASKIRPVAKTRYQGRDAVLLGHDHGSRRQRDGGRRRRRARSQAASSRICRSAPSSAASPTRRRS